METVLKRDERIIASATPSLSTRYATILGSGSYLPEETRTNEDLSNMVDTSDSWIYERTGIKSRHIAGAHESAASMAELAAMQAICTAQINSDMIDLIIVATSTPDRIFPSTACLLQKRLGIKNAIAFDVQAACSGSIYALSIADQYIKAGGARTALVVGSEVCSRIIDWTHRETCILFGDGAGAIILGASSEAGVMSTHLHSDGDNENMLYCPHPQTASRTHSSEASFIQMRGTEVFKAAVKTLSRIVDEPLKANQMSHLHVDWLVPHQANVRIIAATAAKLNMPMKQVVMTLENHGNTMAASVLIAFNEAIRDGRIKRGHTVLLESFGAGFTWGSALIRY